MIRLHLFGSPDLRNAEGHEIHSVLEQPKRLAVLAFLAMGTAGRFHRRDTLLALFWPELDAPRARNALSKSIHYLGRSLGEHTFRTRGDAELALDPAHFWSDVWAFQRAMEAGAYEEALGYAERGPLLEGFHVSGAPDFERWLSDEQERLRSQAVEAATALTDQCEAGGDARTAAAWGRRTMELAPYDEIALRRLLTNLASAGDRVGAVAAFNGFAERLARELEMAPSAETLALVEHLRTPDRPATPGPDRTRADPGLVPSRDVGPRPEASHDPAPTSAVSPRGARPKWIGGAVATLALAAVALLSLARSDGNAPPGGPGFVTEAFIDNRVLVAPLENRTGDPALDALGAMIADWVARAVTATGLVEVTDLATALISVRGIEVDQYPGPEARIQAVAQSLRAPVVVWGSYYQRGEQIEYQLQVTDARAGRLLRALPPVRVAMDDVDTAVDQLRTGVMGALGAIFDERLATLSPPSSPTPRYEAYRQYVDGLDRFVRREYGEAVPHFQRAADLDTTFVLPLIWMVFAYNNSWDLEKSSALVARLATLREQLAPLDRHSVDYVVAADRGDLETAMEAARRAAALAPQSNWNYIVGNMALRTHRPLEGIRAMATLVPDAGWLKGWLAYWGVLSDLYHIAGAHEEELLVAREFRQRGPGASSLQREGAALAALGRVSDLTPILDASDDLEPGERSWLHWYVGAELRAHGHPDAAQAVFERGLARPIATEPQAPEALYGATPTLGTGQILYYLGRWEEARWVFQRLAEQASAESPDRYPTLLERQLGGIAARLGEYDEVERILAWFDEAVASDAPRLRGMHLQRKAAVLAVLGRDSEAISALHETVFRMGALNALNPTLLHADQDFDSLRGKPQFEAILRSDR